MGWSVVLVEQLIIDYIKWDSQRSVGFVLPHVLCVPLLRYPTQWAFDIWRPKLWLLALFEVPYTWACNIWGLQLWNACTIWDTLYVSLQHLRSPVMECLHYLRLPVWQVYNTWGHLYGILTMHYRVWCVFASMSNIIKAYGVLMAEADTCQVSFVRW